MLNLHNRIVPLGFVAAFCALAGAGIWSLGSPATAPAAEPTPQHRVFIPAAADSDTALVSARFGNLQTDENLALRASAVPSVSVTSPTGLGLKNPNALKDGVVATSPETQYDTFNGQNQTFAYFGYVFTETMRFNSLEFQLGTLWEDGGWFVSGTVKIEVYDGKQWAAVPGVDWGLGGGPEAAPTVPFGPPLTAYSIKTARFPAASGLGIRISGQPGPGNGTNAFLGCGELRVFYRTLPPPAGDPRWLMYRHDLAHTGTNPDETQITQAFIGRLQQKWQVNLTPNLALTQTGIFATPSISNGMIFVGSMDGTMHALRLSDGQEVWRRFTSHRFYNPEGGNGVLSSAALVGNAVYIGGDDGTVWALRASDGEVLWKKRYVNEADPDDNLASSAQSSPMISGDSLYIGISNGTADVPCTVGKVLRLDRHDGSLRAVFSTTVPTKKGAGVWSTVALDPPRNRLYVSTGNSCFPDVPPQADNHDNSILALDMNTLQLVWAYRHIVGDTQDLDFGSSPVIFEGKVAAMSKSGFMPAVDIQTGVEVWRVQVATPNASPYDGGGVNSPGYAYGKVFVGGGPVNNPPDAITATIEASFLAVNPADGKVIWRTPLKVTPFGASAIVNKMVFTSDDKDLLVLDADTGKELKRLPVGAFLWGGISVAGGHVLVGDQSGNFYCYTVDGF